MCKEKHLCSLIRFFTLPYTADESCGSSKVAVNCSSISQPILKNRTKWCMLWPESEGNMAIEISERSQNEQWPVKSPLNFGHRAD